MGVCGVFHTLILLVAGLFAAVSSLCMRVARACVTVAWSVSSACLCSWHLSYVGFVGVCGVLECAVRFGAVLVRFVLCVFVCDGVAPKNQHFPDFRALVLAVPGPRSARFHKLGSIWTDTLCISFQGAADELPFSNLELRILILSIS